MVQAKKIGGFWALVRFLRGRESGLSLKLLALFAVAYLILPTDLVPDVIPVLGWLDDIGLLAAAAAFITNRYREVRKRRPTEEGDPSAS